MLSLQSAPQCLHLFLQATLLTPFLLGFESPASVLKELPLPLIKLAGLNVVLFAKIEDRLPLKEMHSQNLNFLFGIELPPLSLGHITVPF
jgi:hypothetical protein